MTQAVETATSRKKSQGRPTSSRKGFKRESLIKVGVNKYTEGEEMEVELHEYRLESAEEQVHRLREVKRERDNRKVSQLLKDLESAARAEKNVMPYLLECCKAYATLVR